MSPPSGNLNRARNGKHLRRLNVGELPAQLRAVKREGRRYRRELEATVLAQLGEITTTAAHAIDTASAATIHAGVCRWLLRERIDKMTASDILACSREITRAKQARDAAVKSLGLDKPVDPYASLYAPRPGDVPTLWPGIPAPEPEPAESAGEPGRCRESSNVSIVDPGASCASDSEPETAGGAE